MSTEPDCLLALKDAVGSGAEISYTNDAGPCTAAGATHLVFGGKSFPKSTPTRYKKPGVAADFYSLDAIYLAWLLRDAPVGEYMKQARENGLTVGFVTVTERKHVVDWLEGRTADSDRISHLVSAESTTPPGTPPRQSGETIPITPRSRAPDTSSITTPAKRKYAIDQHDSDVVKKIKLNEVELRDRNTILRGSKPNNFGGVRTIFAEKLKKAKEASRAPPTSTPAQDPKILARKMRNNQPIIMISSSPTALITMHNVRKFLQEATFESSQDARARAATEGNLRAEDLIPIYRKRTTFDSSGKEIETQAKYLVVDSVEALLKLGNDAWDRVVCVMTTGQEWQFRQYKWSEPLQLFHHVKGICVSWSTDPPNGKIKDWNVTELKIDPYRRHVDKSVVAQFWKILDSWITTNKASLLNT